MVTWRCCVDGKKALLVRHTHTTQLCFGKLPRPVCDGGAGVFCWSGAATLRAGNRLKERDQITLDTLSHSEKKNPREE
jgi:hypothetical protein